MSANEENIGAWRNQYEERLTKLDKELLDLQNERDNLAVALEAATKTNESQKLVTDKKSCNFQLNSAIFITV